MVVLDTGWKTPGTVAGSEFTDPDNIKADDGNYASCFEGMDFSPKYKYYGNPANNFGFNIPLNTTIKGISIRVKAKGSLKSGAPKLVCFIPLYKETGLGAQLYYNGSNIGDASGSSTLAETTDTTITVGDDSSLWGATLTPAIVNDSSFGLSIRGALYPFTNSLTAYVDVVEMKVYYEFNKSTVIDETIDLIINNSYYGLGVESGLLDSFMNNSIKMIELQADNSLTPTSSENLKIDTFSDSNGYLNTVSSATATFDTDKYKRVTSTDETITLNISGVTSNKTACQLYINQIDNEEDCEITYDIISSSSEEELDIPINEYHIIEAFNPTTSKLNGGYIRIHLKNNAAVPTSGYPSIKTYALKLW